MRDDLFEGIEYRGKGDGRVISWASAAIGDGITLRASPSRSIASFEYSVPRMLQGSNLTPASTGEMLSSVGELASRSERFVTWDEKAERFRVMRLDICRDNFFSDPADFDAFVEGQRSLRLRYNPIVQTWSDSSGYTNLRRGRSKRWHMSLYNKHSEILSRSGGIHDADRISQLIGEAEAARGLLRNELMLRRPVLRNEGIDVVADITEDALDRLHRKFFERSGFDQEVGSIDKVKAIAILADEEDQKDLPKVLGYLHMRSLGLPVRWDRKTTNRIRQTAQRLGLSEADISERRTVSVRIDYDSGRLVRGEDE